MEEALEEVTEGLPAIATNAMNEDLSREITERELTTAVNAMAKKEAPGYDEIPVEFFKKLWTTIQYDYHQMILSGIERRTLHKEVTRGLISLIPKDGDSNDLNYWRPITLLTVSYKIFAKALQLRIQSILRDVISPKQMVFLL